MTFVFVTRFVITTLRHITENHVFTAACLIVLCVAILSFGLGVDDFYTYFNHY